MSSNKTSTNKIIVNPYLRSIASKVFIDSNYYNMTNVILVNGSNIATLTFYINSSVITEACMSILIYYETIALKNNFITISYSSRFNFASIDAGSSLASWVAKNFTIPLIYTPTLNKKCVIGFLAFRIADNSERKTFVFSVK